MNVTPYSKAVETEEQIINLSLFNRNACSILMEIEEGEFLDQRHRGIKRIIDSMFMDKKAITSTSVFNEIVSTELRDYFINQIACEQYILDVDTIFTQFQSLHRLVKLQPMIERLNSMAQVGHPDFDEAFEDLQEIYTSSKVVEEAIVMADMMRKRPEEVKGTYVRFKTGIHSLDYKIKYLYGGQYITIAAAPGEGKSTMAGIIAENIPNSLFMSYEMSAEEIHDILISRECGIDSELIETGNLDFAGQRAVETARRELADTCTMRVYDKPLNMSDMFACIKRHVAKYGVQCVVVDYAQIIPGIPGKGNQTEKFEMLSRRFKLLARELKIIVIALSQLNKDSIREGRMPNLGDLRGSLSFGADADKVVFLYQGNCTIGKNRKGSIGSVEGFKYYKPIHSME